jgi:hypothetical protein
MCEDNDAALQAPQSLPSLQGSVTDTETAYEYSITLTVPLMVVTGQRRFFFYFGTIMTQ